MQQWKKNMNAFLKQRLDACVYMVCYLLLALYNCKRKEIQ